jgi:hypothetical protein
MIGLLIPVVLASVVGALWVGSWAGLQRFRILWWPLALAPIAVLLILHNPPFNQQTWAIVWGPGIWIACLMAILVVLVRNGLSNDSARLAFRVAALGVGLNLFVVLANGGFMPQSPEARLAARGVPLIAEGAVPQLRTVAPTGPESRFAWLGDVVAQPSWLPMANVTSIGDLMLSTALALWAFQTIVAGRRRPQVWRSAVDTQ